MLDSQKIILAYVKKAFDLTASNTTGLIHALWPQNVFPWEVWRMAYNTYWRSVAASNKELFNFNNPPFPEMKGVWADASWDDWGSKMYGFFGELAYALPSTALREGLDYIIEATYEDGSTIFPSERELLFAALTEAEKGFNWRQFYPLDKEKIEVMLNDKAYSIPRGHYSFISSIFPDTMVVDKLAAVRYLLIEEYPFRQEVKGLTWHYIERVRAALAAENPITFSPSVVLQSNQETTSTKKPSSKEDSTISVPTALWQGRSFAAVRSAMEDEFAPSVIAYVLIEWCGASKTEAGRLLSEKEFIDEKSYRNLIDDLMKKAAFFTIRKA
jgi:hypothetical protein